VCECESEESGMHVDDPIVRFVRERLSERDKDEEKVEYVPR
jgi:hypothetical protein